jgi:hypothetical protein
VPLSGQAGRWASRSGKLIWRTQNSLSQIAEDPEVVAAFLLVVPAGGAEGFEPANFGLDVVGLQIQVHPLLVRLGVVGPLEQDADVGIGESEFAIDLAC